MEIRFRVFATLFCFVCASLIADAQEDDDSVYQPPGWAAPVVQRGAKNDFAGALRELEKLAPRHRGDYHVPLLSAKIWGAWYGETEDEKTEILALQNERKFLLQARQLLRNSSNAALRAEIETDLREGEALLREAGAPLQTPGAQMITRPVSPSAKAPKKLVSPPKKAPIVRPALVGKTPKLPRLAPRRGYVIGRAIFSDGRPVPSFKVQALGFDGQVNLFPGSTPSLGSTVGKNGRYALRTLDTFRQKKPVSALVVSVQASTKIRYAGRDYTLYLKPLDGLRDGSGKGDFRGNSGPGVVRDFVVAISGVKPQFRLYNQDENEGPNEGSTFYGAQLTLNLSFAEVNGRPLSDIAPRGSTLEVTLVPEGALLDGSRGQTQVRRVRIGPAPYYFYLRNIPIGAYSVSAKLKTPNGETWNLRGSTTRESYGATTTVLFPPSFSDLLGGADTVSLFLVR